MTEQSREGVSSSAAHTPGPWTFGHYGHEAYWVGLSHDETPVAFVPWDNSYARDEARENANLIAAAPELLEDGSDYQTEADGLIRLLLDRLDLDEMDRIQINKWAQASQKFSEAIAKATGAQP